MNRRLFSLAIALVLVSAGCALFEPPQLPRIPTRIPTAPPLVEANVPAAAPAPDFDPFTPVRLGADPDITVLMNAVSNQNLISFVQQLDAFHTRHTLSVTDQPDIGIGAARNWIFNEFLRVGNGRLQVNFNDFLLTYAGRTTSQRNVVATLPGASPAAGAIVLMAHYDSRSWGMDDGTARAPGANDNASGVAALLEVARLMSSRSWNHTVIFIAFAGEEQGTFGSEHYVQRTLINGQRIDAAINNDIIGGRVGIPQSIRIFSAGPANSPSRQLARYAHLIGTTYMPDFDIILQNALDRPDRWSDHRTFVNAGIPALRLTESIEDFNTQHGPGDTWDRLDYSYLAQVTRLNLAIAANLAGAPTTPEPPSIAALADPGDYLLTWAKDPIAAGYALAFRSLDATTYDASGFHYVSANDAGNVPLRDLDPTRTYAVSLAALDSRGRISRFSSEIVIGGP